MSKIFWKKYLKIRNWNFMRYNIHRIDACKIYIYNVLFYLLLDSCTKLKNVKVKYVKRKFNFYCQWDPQETIPVSSIFFFARSPPPYIFLSLSFHFIFLFSFFARQQGDSSLWPFERLIGLMFLSFFAPYIHSVALGISLSRF